MSRGKFNPAYRTQRVRQLWRSAAPLRVIADEVGVSIVAVRVACTRLYGPRWNPDEFEQATVKGP